MRKMEGVILGRVLAHGEGDRKGFSAEVKVGVREGEE